MADDGIDLKRVALRIAQRVRAISVKETVPVGKGSKRWRKATKRGVVEGGHDKQGGELRRSISVSSQGDTAIVGTNKAYARAVHEGRKAVIIRPKKKRALVWSGGNRLAKRVFQPARSGRPFFRDALDAFEANLEDEVKSLEIDGDTARWLRRELESKGLKVQIQS